MNYGKTYERYSPLHGRDLYGFTFERTLFEMKKGALTSYKEAKILDPFSYKRP